MCGFAGFVNRKAFDENHARKLSQKMGDAIRHRGPDDSGIWLDKRAGLALVHRRLSIIDLTASGHQPMVSSSGRFVIVFNGEIYNHAELRESLGARFDGRLNWRGHSDTETLLAAIELLGLEKALKAATGMFALAIWDRQMQSLYLARDRMGEKPVYYGWQNGVFLFGSELKTLKLHPDFVGEIDRDALTLYLRHNYIPTPYSIYKGIKKLKPGCFIKIPLGYKQTVNEDIEPEPYWTLNQVISYGAGTLFSGSDAEAVSKLDCLLRSSVHRQMLSDVPLGAFLSGGIDSSTIVALMQAQSAKPVKTFSIGFEEAGFNEAEYAKAVASHLHTEHTELYVSSQQALNVIPDLPDIYDEPFSDSSQIPTFLVSQMARGHVKVSLSGDAGDELFGGYNRYTMTQRWWALLQKLPCWLKQLGAKGIRQISPEQWCLTGQALSRLPFRQFKNLNFSHKAGKLASVLELNDNSALYSYFVSHWHSPTSVVVNGFEKPTQLTHPSVQLSQFLEQMMALDSLSYLPDNILCKVDRAAMAASLETRIPFLDHHVIQFAWQLPLSMKVRNGQGKWILRQVLDQYVPRELIDRPKMGFGIPLDKWLRGSLREWAENLLSENNLKQGCFFHTKPIRQKWSEHLSGKRNWQYELWDVLMFQAWYEAQNK